MLSIVEPYSKSTFPFQYIIIFQTFQSLESPSSTPGEDKTYVTSAKERGLTLNM